MASSSFIKSNILILIFTFCGIIFNFVSQLILAYYYGTSVERDVFFSASVIATYVITVITTSVSAIFLPTYIEVKTKRTEQDTSRFSRSFFFIFLVILLLICGLLIYKVRYISSIIYPQLNFTEQNLLVDILKVLVFSIFLQCLTGFLTIFYNAQSRFFVSAINPVINTGAIILTVIFLHKSYGIISVAIGTVLGNAINNILILPQLKSVLKKPFSISFNDKQLLNTLRIILFLLLTNVIIRLTPVLERIIASGLDKGSVSYLGYANQIVLVLITVTSSSIATTIFPVLSNAWAEKDYEKLSRNLISSIRVILFISLPIASVFVVFGGDIVKLTFERGMFGPEATQGVSQAISLLMMFFIFASLGNIVFKIFYIANKTKVFILIAFVELFSYIFLAYYLVPYFTYLGLAIALSVSSCINLTLGIFYLVAKLRIISMKIVSAIFAEYLMLFTLHLLLMLGVAYLFSGLKIDLVRLLLQMVVGNACFVLIIHFILKNNELTILLNIILQKFQKNPLP